MPANSRFYGVLRGLDRKATQRLSSEVELIAQARGWRVGGSIVMRPELGSSSQDRALVYANDGTHPDTAEEVFVGVITKSDSDELMFTPSAWTLIQVERYLNGR